MTPTATDQTNRMRHADQPNRMGHDAPSQTRFRLGSMSSSSCAHHVTPFLPLLRRTTAAMEIALVKSPSNRRRRPVSMVICVLRSKTRFLAQIDNYPLAKWPLPRVALWNSSPATKSEQHVQSSVRANRSPTAARSNLPVSRLGRNMQFPSSF